MATGHEIAQDGAARSREDALFDFRGQPVTSIPWLAMLGSTLCWSAFDVLRKRLVQRAPVESIALWVWFAQIPGYALWAAIEASWAISSGYVVPAVLSIALNVLATLLFLESVKRGPLSVTIPILSFTPVFSALFSVPLLGEHLYWSQWLGICAVTGASLFLTADQTTTSNLQAMVKQFFRSPGVTHMLGVAILWSLTPLLDKMALRHTSIGVHGCIMAFIGGMSMAAVLSVRKQTHHIRLPQGTFGLLVTGGAINVAALGLQLLAITQMVVSVFEAFKRAAGLLLAVSFGALLFGEEVGRRRLVAALCMAAGVALVLHD